MAISLNEQTLMFLTDFEKHVSDGQTFTTTDLVNRFKQSEFYHSKFETYFYNAINKAIWFALRRRPVVVCGDPERRSGIVLAASRQNGVAVLQPEPVVVRIHLLCPLHQIFRRWEPRKCRAYFEEEEMSLTRKE